MVNANGLCCFLRISMETHDSCWYNAVELVPLIAPLIILPALIWTCSVRADCTSVMLLIRMSPYSKTGWMKDFILRISKVLQSRRNIRCASISTRWPARFIQSSIWLLHERLLEKITPRCLCAVTSFITEGPIVIGGGESFLFFDETRRDSSFRWAKTSRCSAHLFMVARSLLMLLAASTSSLKSINRVVSSANRCILVPMFSVRSLMKTKNKRDQELSPEEHRHW